MEVMYKVSAGLDVHLKNVVVTVLQGDIEEVREFSTYPAGLTD